LLIGLYSSAAQSGKSTVAARLEKEHGFWRVSFARPLKDMVRGLLTSMMFDEDTVERMVEGDLKEAVIPGFATVTPRHLMQTLGTDWGREAVDGELWNKVARAKIEKLMSLNANVVVDDVRFENEYWTIQNLQGAVVRVHRPSLQRVGSSRYEGLLDNFLMDSIISNDSTMAHLELAADAMFHQLARRVPRWA